MRRSARLDPRPDFMDADDLDLGPDAADLGDLLGTAWIDTTTPPDLGRVRVALGHDGLALLDRLRGAEERGPFIHRLLVAERDRRATHERKKDA